MMGSMWVRVSLFASWGSQALAGLGLGLPESVSVSNYRRPAVASGVMLTSAVSCLELRLVGVLVVLQLGDQFEEHRNRTVRVELRDECRNFFVLLGETRTVQCHNAHHVRLVISECVVVWLKYSP